MEGQVMRNLATVEVVVEVKGIPDATAIEAVRVKGWWVVVKKGEFKPRDLCIFFEVDSLLPEDSRYEFLRKSSWQPRLHRYRLKTVMLRKQISQGLVLPLSLFPEVKKSDVGYDVTDTLNVIKYEPALHKCLSGTALNFTWPITKTNEDRIQSNPRLLQEIEGKPFYVTVKLDGTSASYLMVEEGGRVSFHACSHKYSLARDENSIYWRISKRYEIEENLRAWYSRTGETLAIQGEIVGPNIQGNKLGLSEHKLYVFNVVNTKTNERYHYNKLREILIILGLEFVPLISEGNDFGLVKPETLQELLIQAEFPYRKYFPTAQAKQEGEGLVVRSQDQSISFKVISNAFLLAKA